MQRKFYHGLENCPTKVYKDYITASTNTAHHIAQIIQNKKNAVLGICAGSTPTAVYKELCRLHLEENLSFANVNFFILDEYYPMAQQAPQSKRAELQEELLQYLDTPAEQIHSLDGIDKNYALNCKHYELKITEVGGIDFILLGIGGTGHIGANEPGSLFDSETRRVPLDSVTRIAAASNFKGEEFVPTSALTMGLGTIMKAKEIHILAFGEGKSSVVQKLVEDEATPDLPASVIQKHANSLVVLDSAAASELTRIKTPWLKEVCDWRNEKLVKKAVIWLCKKVQKPILKLTNRDYMDNGMGDLITLYESAYSLNIKLFNQIQHTITGWPGGKPGVSDEYRPERTDPAQKRVIVFSPHPDDDVISMGGTLARLVNQKHDVHVAYQTNGNLAVADSKVQEVIDLLRELQTEYRGSVTADPRRLGLIEEFLNARDPQSTDIADVQVMKRLIRKVETISACRYIGIPQDHNHHLDLPFYQTGTVRKKPLVQDDIDIVKALLQEIQPHQIFAAGDLSDPHGTHRVCLNAIYTALDQLKGVEWLQDCRVWLYRGAWAEWPVEEADMAVPISPEELMRKRVSIYKHISQKDGALFPGADVREFWQRAEARNRGTADAYNHLGFAEYEAIELFARYDGHLG